MADNVTALANTGTGTDVLATDEISGVHYPRSKVGFGPDGIYTDVSSADPLPVAAASLPLPSGAATEASLATVAGAVKAEDSAAVSGDLGIPMLAMRQAADTTSTDTDGDYTLLKIDEEGRLKVSTKPASYAAVTGNVTSATSTIPTNVERFSNLMVHCTGTFSTVNCIFEGSLNSTNGTDGNWFTIQAIRTNANTIETTTGNLSAAPAYAWELSVNAMKWFRIRATAWTSGTQVWTFIPGTYATEPIPGAQISGTQPVSGSVTATLTASTVRAAFYAAAGIWYDDNSTNLGAGATFTGTSRDLTVTATATAMANAATYAMELRISAESDVTGTLWLETSRDNVNWRRVKSVATAAVTGGGFFAEIIHRPSWRYARVGYTNGGGAQARFTIGSLITAA